MNSQLSARSRSQIRNRSGKLAGKNIRNYPQWTCLVSATNSMIGAIVITASSENHPIIIRFFSGIIRFTQGICRFSSSAPKTNRPTIDRRNHGIDRISSGQRVANLP